MGDGLLETERTAEPADAVALIGKAQGGAGGELARTRDVARRGGSIRTSGAGTRPASRSGTRPGTRSGRRRSCGRCSPASGATAFCRTSCSPTGRAYFPGPSSGRRSVRRTPRSGRGPRESSSRRSTRPPRWQVYRRRADRERATAFLEELLPRLAAWHEYLYRERAATTDGLVEIWHPWESGMDNSPLWDEALERMSLDPERDAGVRARRRRGRGGGRAAVRRRVRPLRLSRRPVPRARVRPLANPGARCRSRSSRCCSTRCSSSRTATWPRSRASLGVGRRSVRGLGREHRSRARGSLWDEEQAVYLDYDVIARRAGRRRDGGRSRAALRGRPDARAERSAWSSGSRTRASPSATPGGP